MVYIVYFLMWRISCISWCGVQSFVSPDVAYILFLAFPDITYILYFLMWRTFCISLCDVQYIVSTDVAYILFFRQTYLSWYGVHPVFPYVTYFLYFLMWRTIFCISWCGVYLVLSISWYNVHPVFPDVAYFLYFFMWRTIHCIDWCGVYIVLQTNIPFLIWRTSCFSLCDVLLVFPGVAYNK